MSSTPNTTSVALSREYLELKCDRDPKLQAEFPTREAYVALCRRPPLDA